MDGLACWNCRSRAGEVLARTVCRFYEHGEQLADQALLLCAMPRLDWVLRGAQQQHISCTHRCNSCLNDAPPSHSMT